MSSVCTGTVAPGPLRDHDGGHYFSTVPSVDVAFRSRSPRNPQNTGETGRESGQKGRKSEKPSNHKANRRPS
jgi:hypothetical protein